MLLEYQLDWIKIMDFLLIAKFLTSANNFRPPSRYLFREHGKQRFFVIILFHTFLIIICKLAGGRFFPITSLEFSQMSINDPASVARTASMCAKKAKAELVTSSPCCYT